MLRNKKTLLKGNNEQINNGLKFEIICLNVYEYRKI